MITRRQALASAASTALMTATESFAMTAKDMILINAKVTTLDRENPVAEAVAIRDGKFLAVGREQDVRAAAGPDATVIDAQGRRLIPGLIDSHIHVIRGGLNYNMELRWEGVPSLSEAMAMLKRQAENTPPPQWVRVVGGFTEHQFAEKRLPTISEINAAAPDTPVFILHLYDRALLNAAALRAVGYTRDTPNPPGGEIVRDAQGNPTGLLLAQPNAMILYATLAKGPKLPPDYQLNSTKHFMRELNSLGVTSVIDAGGGSQNYPDDYAIVEKLHQDGELTLRIAYNLFTQKPKEELKDFASWSTQIKPGDGDDSYRHNGAGEMLVYSAADFEDFRVARPDMAPEMEGDLEPVIRLLAERRWPWRLHATYDQTIGRALDVFEKVNKDIPLTGLNWFFDHAETISDRNIDRVAALGGGIAVQHRMAFQGEYFVERYGAKAAEATPPIAKMMAAGIPVGAGTDATRVASYNPWVSLSWLVTSKTVGGLRLYPVRNRLDRETALRLWTERNTWFSNEVGKKGQIKAGQLADLALLSDDYFSVPEDDIALLRSVLTVLGGRIVYGEGEFGPLAPTAPKAMPDWSPVATFGGHYRRDDMAAKLASACGCASGCAVHGHDHAAALGAQVPAADVQSFWGAVGCGCWAV
ncbi:amidohydrolase [Sphingobium sp. SA2]|uniref:amidohydrolase n=1 Tax=unclassified Sphingobium TaxID=2611147 RepID=UPI00083D5FF7|nr:MULTISPECIES: amidohydrolase [unclassified Sphingobium]AOF95008.1 amidohydrolase family protein [Sphingobium sp. RAC03]MDT7532719.1 amidohydrolase [Sphingobium sp. SA2]